MSQFLKLCEEFTPENADSLKEAAFQAKFFLYEHDIPFSSEGNMIIFHSEHGDITLQATGFTPRNDGNGEGKEEDESVNADTGTYEVDKEVENLGDKASSGLKGQAAKLFGTSAQRAKSAVKERQNVAGQAVDAYRKGTQRITKSLNAVKQSAMGRSY